MTDIILLDGGIGQEVVRLSGKPAAPLWSTQVMIEQPGIVAQVHQAYADAGATVATTNSYALHRDRLRGGASNHYAAEGAELPNLEDKIFDLLGAALTEAETVKSRSRIAGSIGPLGASYRADVQPPFAEAVPLYAEIAKALAPRVDLLLFETVPSIEAAAACLAGGRQTDRPVWISFTVDDEDGSLLRSGEAVKDAVDIIKDADAVLVNCSAPEVMHSALDALAPAGVPMGAYANAFTQITKNFLDGGISAKDLSPRPDMTPELYAAYALKWLDHGATILGGCCETGPAHIAEIAKTLQSEGHSII